LGYISDRYAHYHTLSDDQVQAFGEVMSVLKTSASWYKADFGKVPVLIIDGVDILAKKYKEICCQLVSYAKVLANDDELKLVLVSSEGTILPLIKHLSGTNRALMYEVGDITDKEAENYLVQVGVEPEKAKKLVNVIGGRLVHLRTSVALLGRYTGDDYCEAITEALFSRDLYAQRLLIERRVR